MYANWSCGYVSVTLVVVGEMYGAVELDLIGSNTIAPVFDQKCGENYKLIEI